MNSSQLANEIRDLNLSFLMLAQASIRSDKAQAMFRLGIPESVADLVENLSHQQIVRIASRNMMMCTLRFGDEMIWDLLADRHAPAASEDSNASRLHASVLMAGQRAASLVAAA